MVIADVDLHITNNMKDIIEQFYEIMLHITACAHQSLFVLMLYVPVNIFQACWDVFRSSWVDSVLSRG